MRKSALLTAFLLAAQLSASDLADDAALVLQQNCTGCHGADKQMGNLDLRTLESALEGGERGLAVEPGKSAESRLYKFVAGLEKPYMPPGKRLPAEDIETIRKWIDAGAKVNSKENAQAAPKEKAPVINTKLESRTITPQDRQYWAFVPPAHPPLPLVGTTNPIDAFVLATLQTKKLKPAGPADRRSLIRRAYLDLTGLPPTPANVQAFLNDHSPNAFSNLVEELLASPHYGERWGRHWLDTVRYADSGGFEYDRDRDNAWRYRDYVIKAFNDDKPYNQFVQEQIAGDEIDPKSFEGRIATGYLRLGLENNLKNEQTRMDELDDLVATTSNTFLGLTVGCARCHNHKFDPIAQKDYYRMQAVFFSTKAVEYPLVGEEQLNGFKAAQAHITELQAPLKAKLTESEKPYKERLIAEKKSKLPEYVLLALKTPLEQRTEGQKLNAEQVEKTLTADLKEILAVMPEAEQKHHQQVSKEIADLDEKRPQPLPTAMAITEKGREAMPSYFLYRGSPGSKGSLMKPGVIAVASQADWQFPEPPAGATTTWRRRGLAAWIASPENPLTARVMVNRIWQHHFGEGIVRTPNNFGKMGERPTHPEMLDWLATEFVKQNWSVKAMHRLLMNSETYQRASDDVAANLEIDGENRYFWRMPRQRLEAEGIRDSMMAAAGNLDLLVGGSAVHPYIDPALFQSSSKRTWVGKPDTDPETWRRSVYVFSKRSIPLPMLEVFDKPDSVGSCARRNRSTIAPQALILMNNSFVLLEAEIFAGRLRREAGNDPAAQANLAFQLALSRPPSHSESERAVTFIRGDAKALVDFCQTILNLNEFAYIP